MRISSGFIGIVIVVADGSVVGSIRYRISILMGLMAHFIIIIADGRGSIVVIVGISIVMDILILILMVFLRIMVVIHFHQQHHEFIAYSGASVTRWSKKSVMGQAQPVIAWRLVGIISECAPPRRG